MVKIQAKYPFPHEVLPDDNHSYLTIVTSHTLGEVTDTVLGKYRWIKILKELNLVMEIYRRASSCNAE